MKVLNLVLKHHWYDMIASGVKKEEYRELKEFYFKRLNMEWYLHLEQGCYKGCDEFAYDPKECVGCKKFNPYPYDAICFHRGYTKTSMLVELKGIRIGKGNPEWGAPDYAVFILSLGEILEETTKE